MHIPGLTLDDLLNAAFHPLRRAASDNLLMLQHVADALKRLHGIAADEDTKRLMCDHAVLLLETYQATRPIRFDLEFLQRRLSPLIDSVPVEENNN